MTSGGQARRDRTQALLRVREAGSERVTSMELFFDLVYVFAVTQLSHSLLAHLTLRGALQTLLLLMAVWWAWISTAWLTNWFNPNVRGVRLILLTIMLCSLIMSATLPEAFDGRGAYFALAYVAIQVGRVSWAVFALRGELALQRNFQRILVWAAGSGTLWITGGFAHGSTREALWLVAVIADCLAPAAGFYTPRLRRSTTADWTIAGAHLAERSQLFVIVALGESILVTGATFSGMTFSPSVVTAFIVSFIGSVALWWVYFDRAAEEGSAIISSSTDPGRLGRSAYTYSHVPIIAGIIVAAVGDELAITHPLGETNASTALVLLGGPALFLAGHALYKRSVFGRLSYPRLAAIGALAALAPFALIASPLVLSAAATLVVVGVGIWDSRLHLPPLEAAQPR